jgi:hypothetical protein
MRMSRGHFGICIEGHYIQADEIQTGYFMNESHTYFYRSNLSVVTIAWSVRRLLMNVVSITFTQLF